MPFSCPRWFKSWPAMVSTIVWKVMVPRSGWVTGFDAEAGSVAAISFRFHCRMALKAARAYLAGMPL